MDSNRLRAVVGASRPLTIAEHQMRNADIEGVYGEVCSPVLDKTGERLDYTEMIASPGLWATDDMLHAIASWLPSRQARTAFRVNPDGFLQTVSPDGETTWIEHPSIATELDRQWLRYVSSTISQSVRTAAIVEVFGSDSTA